jgi:uncharacterized cupin superfamily protein
MTSQTHFLTPQYGDANRQIGEGWTVLEGAPQLATWIEHRSNDGSIVAGTWHASPGTLRAEYRFYEFVVMIEGLIEITPDGGETMTVRGGDSFAIEADFKGVWKIIEPVRKRFLLKLA